MSDRKGTYLIHNERQARWVISAKWGHNWGHDANLQRLFTYVVWLQFGSPRLHQKVKKPLVGFFAFSCLRRRESKPRDGEELGHKGVPAYFFMPSESKRLARRAVGIGRVFLSSNQTFMLLGARRINGSKAACGAIC
jgi:hypothetical protein